MAGEQTALGLLELRERVWAHHPAKKPHGGARLVQLVGAPGVDVASLAGSYGSGRDSANTMWARRPCLSRLRT